MMIDLQFQFQLFQFYFRGSNTLYLYITIYILINYILFIRGLYTSFFNWNYWNWNYWNCSSRDTWSVDDLLPLLFYEALERLAQFLISEEDDDINGGVVLTISIDEVFNT